VWIKSEIGNGALALMQSTLAARAAAQAKKKERNATPVGLHAVNTCSMNCSNTQTTEKVLGKMITCYMKR